MSRFIRSCLISFFDKIPQNIYFRSKTDLLRSDARFYAKFWRCGPCFCIEQEEQHVQILVPDSRSVPPIQRVPSPLAWRTTVSTLTAPVLPAFLRLVAPVTLKGAKARTKKSRNGPATRISGAVSVQAFITESEGNCWKESRSKGRKGGKKKELVRRRETCWWGEERKRERSSQRATEDLFFFALRDCANLYIIYRLDYILYIFPSRFNHLRN